MYVWVPLDLLTVTVPPLNVSVVVPLTSRPLLVAMLFSDKEPVLKFTSAIDPSDVFNVRPSARVAPEMLPEYVPASDSSVE